MKLLSSIFIILIFGLLLILNHLDNKLNNLSLMTESLKTENSQLKKKNKKLNHRNEKLEKREKQIHKKITDRRKSLTLKKMSKAKRKLISAGPKMAPILGISMIIASTTYDINSYCEEISEMEQFEYELFGDKSLQSSRNKICGINVKAKLQQTGNNIKYNYITFINSIKKEYSVTHGYWKNATSNFIYTVDKNNKQVGKYWMNFFD